MHRLVKLLHMTLAPILAPARAVMARLSPLMQWARRHPFLTVIITVALGCLPPILADWYIGFSTADRIFSSVKALPERNQPADAVLVPGAKVYSDGSLSPILYDRVMSALEVYRAGRAKKFLLSGDHGTKYYNEVGAMRKFLQAQGIPDQDIFLDHAGFSTHNSMVRAAKIFGVRRMVISTQAYHLPRSVFLARSAGIDAYGYIADKRRYLWIRRYKIREFAANSKAALDVLLRRRPHFLGKRIPITGDGRITWD